MNLIYLKLIIKDHFIRNYEYYWIAINIVAILIFIASSYSSQYWLLIIILWLQLMVIYQKLISYKKVLSDLNDKFAINQRKLSKSLKTHNDFVNNCLLEQKQFFKSIVNPKKDYN